MRLAQLLLFARRLLCPLRRVRPAMFANVFPSPYIDILRLFQRDWELAEISGDAQMAIDKAIGKRVFALRGKTAATNYLALPRPSSAGLGLEARLLYLQIRLTPNVPFTVHIDLLTQRKFVRRISISSRYSVIKRVGTVVQVPCPDLLRETAGRWAVLALDLHKIGRAVLPISDGEYQSLKSLVFCATMSLRAAFITDKICARAAARAPRSARAPPPVARPVRCAAPRRAASRRAAPPRAPT